jgi:hypothetical protein
MPSSGFLVVFQFGAVVFFDSGRSKLQRQAEAGRQSEWVSVLSALSAEPVRRPRTEGLKLRLEPDLDAPGAGFRLNADRLVLKKVRPCQDGGG